MSTAAFKRRTRVTGQLEILVETVGYPLSSTRRSLALRDAMEVAYIWLGR